MRLTLEIYSTIKAECCEMRFLDSSPNVNLEIKYLKKKKKKITNFYYKIYIDDLYIYIYFFSLKFIR